MPPVRPGTGIPIKPTSEFNLLIRNFGTSLPVSNLVHGMTFWLVNNTSHTITPYWYDANAVGGPGWFAATTAGGGISGVTATAPIASSAGTTPNISWNPTGTIQNNNQQIAGLVAENLSTAPTGGGLVTGRLYLNTADQGLYFYNGSFWNRFLTGDYLVPTNASADPGGVTGKIYFNTSINGLKYYNGSGWVTVLNDLTSGTGIAIGGAGASRSVSLTASGVTAGSYTTPNFTVDIYGRVTAASNGSTTYLTNVTGIAPIVVSGVPPNPNISLQVTASNSGGATATQTANSASSNQGGVVHQQGFVTNGTVLDQIMSGTSISPPGVNGIIAQGDRGYNPTTRIQYNYTNTVGTGGWYQSNVPATFGAFPTSPPTSMRVYRNDLRADFTYDGSAWRQGSVPDFNGSFPSSPPTGMRVFRSDRNLEYTYDGTRWLTTNVSYIPLIWNPGLVTTTPGNVGAAATLMKNDNAETTQDIYLISIACSSLYNGGSSYDASNSWDFQFYTVTSSGATLRATLNTWQTGRTTGTRYPNTASLNLQLSAANAASFRLDLATHNGTPGPIAPNPAVLTCRYVG